MNEMQMDIAGFGNYRVFFLNFVFCGGMESFEVIFGSKHGFFGSKLVFSGHFRFKTSNVENFGHFQPF